VSILRRPEAALFALVFGAYAYFYQAGGWNQNSRFDLTRAIVEQGTIAIDAFHENTGDKAERDGHWYSDKAPGLSWLMVPPYAAVHLVRPGAVAAGAYLSTVFALGLPSALAAVLMFRLGLLLGLSAAGSAAIACAYALGTLAFPYSTILYGHQLQAALGFAAFALVAARRAPFAAGLLLGYAVCVDYTAALLALVVTAYAASRLGARGALRVIAGGVIPAMALGAYHAAAFGHPLALPYHFVLQEHRRQGWFMGIGAPDPAVLGKLLWGEYRGLFFSSPWLLAGIPGFVALAGRGFRAEAAAAATTFAAYLLMNAGLVDWHGGWAMGPRYLIPAIPFLAVGAMGFIPAASRARRVAAIAGGVLASFSFVLMLIGTAVRPDVPLSEERPYRDYLLPLLARGRVARSNHAIDSAGGTGARQAWNLGHVMGLDGVATLFPLAIAMGAGGAWLIRAVRVRTHGSRV
jgi:hypothetical protein